MRARPAIGCDVAQEVERELAVKRHVDGVRGRGHQQRVAVRRLIDHVFGRDVAGRAGLVLDDHLLTEALGQRLREAPRQDVGRAAGREADHEPHRPASDTAPTRCRRSRSRAPRCRGQDAGRRAWVTRVRGSCGYFPMWSSPSRAPTCPWAPSECGSSTLSGMSCGSAASTARSGSVPSPGIARVPSPSLPNSAGLGSPGSSTPSEICAYGKYFASSAFTSAGLPPERARCSGSMQITAWRCDFLDQPHGLWQRRERADHGELERAGQSELPREVTRLDEIVALARPVLVGAHDGRVFRPERGAELHRGREACHVGIALQVEAVEVEHRQTVEPRAHLGDQRGVADHRMERQAGRAVHAQTDPIVSGRQRCLDVVERRRILQRRRRDDDLTQGLPR